MLMRDVQFALALTVLLAATASRTASAVATSPAVGDVIINEYVSDNDKNDND